MADNNIIIQQGVIVPSGTIMYTAPSGKNGHISNIKINNLGSAYVVSIYRYVRTLNSRILLFSLSLSDGDIVNDDTYYKLSPGDYLYATSNVLTATYVIDGSESIAL